MAKLWSRAKPTYELPFDSEITIDAGASRTLHLGDRLDTKSGLEVNLSVDCGLLPSCVYDKDKNLLRVTAPESYGQDALAEYLIRVLIDFTDSSISPRRTYLSFTLMV